MLGYKIKLHYNGPIVTVHLTDPEGNLQLGIAEKLEEAIEKAVGLTVNKKIKESKAVKILEEFSASGDTDKLLEDTIKFFNK